MNVSLVAIKNDFYGNSVTVTGLLTGKDIVSQLSSRTLGDAVWMSHRILNDDGLKTLDDMTIDDMSLSLGCPISISIFICLYDSFNLLKYKLDNCIYCRR